MEILQVFCISVARELTLQSQIKKMYVMKKFILAIATVFALSGVASAQTLGFTLPSSYSASQTSEKASMRFSNQSDYTMTVRILHAGGGYYNKVVLYPHSSSTVYFSRTARFKIKIKATSSSGHTSYHDGGKFSVTCDDRGYSEGEMTFRLSSYGSGLGPSISAKEFESNY